MSTNERAPRIYTRTGDKGKTSLIGGKRVSKADRRLEAYGTIDELNSFLGLLVHDLRAEFASASHDLSTDLTMLTQFLKHVQSDLFNIGSQLACEDPAFRSQLPNVTDSQITDLEEEMDRLTTPLKPLKNFILPGGARSASVAHIARTVCRRAERLCVNLSEEQGEAEVDPVVIRFLNRLSDYLFVLARFLNHCLEIDEPIWVGKKA